MHKLRYDPYSIPKSKSTHAHCMQATPLVYATEFREKLSHGSAPRRKYVPRDTRTYISTLHRGQRKLLMSEMGALVKLDPQTRYTAVYAGAAPGIHTPLLSELFPNIVFHLYDPAPFEIKETERIKLFNGFFTDDTAREYRPGKHENLVFICDIRQTFDEKMVWGDMLSQKRWHEIMQPELTSLKMRLPWPGKGVVDQTNMIEYLDGDIMLPIWGPHNTTETRLVIQRNVHTGTKLYDCLAYEEEMCYFNKVVRPSVHQRKFPRDAFLDGCYDCTAELAMIKKYTNIWRQVDLSSARISMELKRSIAPT